MTVSDFRFKNRVSNSPPGKWRVGNLSSCFRGAGGSLLCFFLLQKDVNFLQEAFDGSASTGLPRYYAVFDINNFIVAPTPNSNYAIELHYYYRPASLTAGADSGTTWLSTNAPFALLYGSLVEAYTFMKGEPDVIQNYNGLFGQYLERVKDLGEARENTDGYRVGLPSRPRT